MGEKDKNVAKHMIAHCERVERYLAKCDFSLEKFMCDELVQDGVAMQLLAMGELTTHFSEEFKAMYPDEIDWRNFKQLRNICAHRYGTLDSKATPHKERLTALHAICLHLFRHIAQKTLDIRQYAC